VEDEVSVGTLVAVLFDELRPDEEVEPEVPLEEELCR